MWTRWFGTGTFATMAILLGAGSAAAQQGGNTPSTEVKKLFASNCSWCHGSFGMTADKAPRLAGTEMTEEQVEKRIRNGKDGYMPPFGKVLSDAEIATIATYIKGLKVEE